MNSLGINLKIGDEVLVKAECLTEEFLKISDRIFVIDTDCFGNNTFTRGTAIGGYWKQLGKEKGSCRIEGYMLEKLLTKEDN